MKHVSMKKIDKDKLDEVIRVGKRWWKSGDVDILKARNAISKDNIECPDLREVVGELVRYAHYHNLTYQVIYNTLEALGIKILDDEDEEMEKEE